MKMLVLALIVVGAALVSASPAQAGCHAFSISVSPTTVDEGGSITVTVSRDGSAGPSRVHVRTIAGSAQAPQDYDGLAARPVAFTTETSKSFTLAIRNDAATEADESFSLRLVDGDGCPPNPRFRYGPDAVVTIRSNDQATSATSAPATEAPTAEAPTAAAPSPTADTDAGLSSGQIGLIAVVAAGILALIALAFALGRRRSTG